MFGSIELIVKAAQPWVAFAALFALALMLAAAFAAAPLARAWSNASRAARAVAVLAVAVATIYGGTKGRIYFPVTDPETRYLTDAGSYVTNDYVHVAFTRSILVPTSATFYLDRCDVKWTNAVDIATNTVTAKSEAFSTLTVPFDFAFPAATNYNWFAYTDWTPPPVVHTNGVAFIVWQIGSTTNRLATTRTGVYTNAVRLAPNPAMTNLPPFTLQLTTTPNEENQ